MKALLLTLLDIAQAAYPTFGWLWSTLRQWADTVSFLDGPSPLHVVGGPEGAAPPGVADAIAQALTSLAGQAGRPLIKAALLALARLSPYLVDLGWDKLFPTVTKPVHDGPMHAALPDFAQVLADVG